jgi:GT2 family glycosyltransferase
MVVGQFPVVRVLKNTRNEGFARGNNQAVAVSLGDILLLLGSDVLVQEGSIRKMCDYLRSHPDVGAVSCRLINPDGSNHRSCRRFPRLRDAVWTYLSLHGFASEYNMTGFDYERTQEVQQPSATCFMLPKSVLRGTKLFDERFTILYNDVDLCKRIWNNGSRIVYLADAAIVHHGSQSTKHATPGLRLEMYRNILVYYSREFGVCALIVLLPILAIRLALANRGRKVIGLFSLKYLNES